MSAASREPAHSGGESGRAAAVDAFERLTPGSRAAWERAREVLPGGVASNVKFFAPYPVYLSHARGACVWDVDGRQYVDCCLAFGPVIAGHGHPHVDDAIRGELARAGTTILGAPSPLETTLAERVCRLVPSAEMVRFTNSGTEATLHALRLARGLTGRPRIIKFEGHYHGVHDSVLMNLGEPLPPSPASDGIPDAVRAATTVVPFNDVAAVRAAFAAHHDIAAVIVEPIARGVIQPEPGFLQELRALTERAGALLVFDEIVAWPRVGLGGAQSLYGVMPDVTTLGKALGGGLPLGAIAGRRDVMRALVPKSARIGAAGPHVFHGGTYNGTPIALAAAHAVLDLLEAEGALAELFERAEQLRSGLRQRFEAAAAGAQVLGYGAVADFYFSSVDIRSARDVWASDLERRRTLDYALLARGVYNAPVHRWHLSLAHGERQIAQLLDALADALRETNRIEAPASSVGGPVSRTR